jgi:hypothetical protein
MKKVVVLAGVIILLVIGVGVNAIPGRSILLQDDFNDGDNNGWTVHQGDWQVINGEYVYGANGISDIDGVTASGDSSWKDYDFESRFKLLEGDDQVYFLFRFSNFNTFQFYDGYTLQRIADRWAVLRWSASQPWVLVAQEQGSSTINTGEWYDVRIEVNGDHFKIFVNKKLIIDAYDSAHPNGRIGFRGDVSKIAFDDVVVVSEWNRGHGNDYDGKDDENPGRG